jgi:hypothetical protein
VRITLIWLLTACASVGPPAPRPHGGPLRAVDLAFSGSFCALRSDGRVVCWGRDSGVFGDRSLEPRSVAAEVPGLDEVVSLHPYPSGDVGGFCAVRSDRSLWCWGFEEIRTTLPVTRVLDDAQSVVFTRRNGVCVRHRDGAFQCVELRARNAPRTCHYWAEESRRQCLDSALDKEAIAASYRETDTLIEGGLEALHRAHWRDACVRAGEKVYCHGANDVGQLGDPAASPGPGFREVPGLGRVTALLAEWERSCAVRPDGQLLCWGGSTSMWPDPEPCLQASNGERVGCNRRLTPLPVPPVAALLGRPSSPTLLTRAGQVLEPIFEGRQPPRYRSLDGLPPLVKLVAGRYGLCGLTAAGQVHCRGHASELGDGNPIFDRAPAPIPGLVGATRVRVMRRGGACALVGDQVVCWHVEQAARGLPAVAELGDGCMRGSDARVWCWGFNAIGEMGLGHGPGRPGLDPTFRRDDSALIVTPAPVPRIRDVVQLASDDDQRCALDRQGAVRCWGGFLPGRPMETYTSLGLRGLPPVSQLWLSRDGIFALARDGRIWMAPKVSAPAIPLALERARALPTDGADADSGGDPEAPKLCLIATDGSARCHGMPAPIVIPGPVKQLSLGEGRGCALLEDGRLQCWGGSYCAESSRTYCRRDQVWGHVETVLDGVVQVSVGSEYSCALRRDTRVWCWGNASPLRTAGGQPVPARVSQVNLAPPPITPPGVR